MTTPTAIRPTTDAGMPRSNPARIYVTEARHEFLKLIRIPIFAVSTIALPDGRDVDFVIRREVGSINRFLYSFAMLTSVGERADAPETTAAGAVAEACRLRPSPP